MILRCDPPKGGSFKGVGGWVIKVNLEVAADFDYFIVKRKLCLFQMGAASKAIGSSLEPEVPGGCSIPNLEMRTRQTDRPVKHVDRAC